MGTRHMIGVISNKKYRIAQYGQWDGYVSGQGATVLNFLKEADLKVFRQKLANTFFVTKEDLRQYYIEAGDSPNNTSGFVSMEIADKLKELHPSLHRDIGGNILQHVYESTTRVPLVDNSDFIEDDTFCEFAYVIDFDQNKLLCYCWGKHLFASYDLENLPTVEQMEADYDKFEKE